MIVHYALMKHFLEEINVPIHVLTDQFLQGNVSLRHLPNEKKNIKLIINVLTEI